MLVLPLLMAVLVGGRMLAQDASETPLGDVARSLRKKNTAQEKVIDDDNLPQVMDEADKKRGSGPAWRFLMDRGEKGFAVSAPDVTCSLAFTANVKSLLSNQYAQMNLPAEEVAKLSGQATIEGDALVIPVFNGTSWHVSELTIALTVVRKTISRTDTGSGPLHFGPAAQESAFDAVRPEKKPDETTIYRMRAAAAPLSQTTFNTAIDQGVKPEDEWHWAIVEARGYPPQSFTPEQTGAQSRIPATLTPASAVIAPQDQAPVPSPIPQ